MNLTDMRAIVRRDLHDEDSVNYRWTDNEIDRHIARALKEFSEALPLEQKATLATVSGSREISVVSLTNRVMIEAIEYPLGQFPKSYQRFAFWNDVISILGPDIPDGSNCYVYYGKLHTLDGNGSTIPSKYEDLVATGAEGLAARQLAGYTINQVNTGGTETPTNWESWGQKRISFFREELKRLGRRNGLRVRQLYSPFIPIIGKTTDWGP